MLITILLNSICDSLLASISFSSFSRESSVPFDCRLFLCLPISVDCFLFVCFVFCFVFAVILVLCLARCFIR